MYSRKILPGILIGCTSRKDSRVFMKVSEPHNRLSPRLRRSFLIEITAAYRIRLSFSKILEKFGNNEANVILREMFYGLTPFPAECTTLRNDPAECFS
jgi:hypothetical protein